MVSLLYGVMISTVPEMFRIGSEYRISSLPPLPKRFVFVYPMPIAREVMVEKLENSPFSVALRSVYPWAMVAVR